MTERKLPDFLQKLLKMLKADGVEIKEFHINPDGSLTRIDSEGTSGPNPSKLIHSQVEMPLIHALEQWFESQTVSEGTVRSTLAFMLAHEIYFATDSEDQACRISGDYERYIHQTVHILRDTYGAPKKVD